MNKRQYLTKMRKLYRVNIGEEANSLKEIDFISDLAEDGWPDYEKWLEIYCRLFNGGKLTDKERDCAFAYYEAGENTPVEENRLK